MRSSRCRFAARLNFGVRPQVHGTVTRRAPCILFSQVNRSRQVHQQRTFSSHAYFQAGADEPPRVVITENPDAAVVCWHVEPGQRIELHFHPTGQDTWIVLSGEGLYFESEHSTGVPLLPGTVAVAPRGAIHGALNTGTAPLRFVSVVSPAESGFVPTVRAGTVAA